MKALVVDDEESLAITLQANLELEGFEVHTANSGEQALSLLAAGAYDLVLSDIKMPGMNGVELFRRIRKAHPGTPVILMTGFAMEGLVAEAISEGVFTVFAKPFDIDQIAAVSKRAVRRPVVLVVDEEGSDARSTAAALVAAGLRAQAAGDAEEALETIRASCVDVCVIDLLASEKRGGDFVRRVLEIAEDIRLVAVSGYDVPELLEKVSTVGGLSWMQKPYALHDLIELIAKTRRQNSQPVTAN